jgi:hypothetical protein
MSEHKVILDDSFWKFLVSLEELVEKKDRALFCSSLNLDDEELLKYQMFLKEMDVQCEIDQSFIYPLKEKFSLKIEFSLSEWLAFQAAFKDKENSSYYHRIVQNKLQIAQMAHEQFVLYKKPAFVISTIEAQENLNKQIDFAICYKKPLEVHFHNGKMNSLYPHRLVFLDGILCVVGESLKDKTLVYFGVEDIATIGDLKVEHEPNLSQIEINDFINHLRIINGKEERLILKIYSQYDTDLLPSHHFLENPFVTSNAEGDMIWAATIEMCDDVFQWLYNMRDRVEILDPGHIRKEFSLYCELKKQSSGLKKAS